MRTYLVKKKYFFLRRKAKMSRDFKQTKKDIIEEIDNKINEIKEKEEQQR